MTVNYHQKVVSPPSQKSLEKVGRTLPWRREFSLFYLPVSSEGDQVLPPQNMPFAILILMW